MMSDRAGRDFGFGLPPLPCIAGRELAGEVAQVSPGNTKWKVGDRVRDDGSILQLLPFRR